MSTVASAQIRFFGGPDGQRIAYAMAGTGPPLVCPAWWVSHVERDSQSERFRSFFEPLARHHTVVRYDRPGVGLSERERSSWSLESEVAVLSALIEHLDSERVSLLGFSCGGPPSVVYASRHPERIEKLLFFGSYANGRDLGSEELQKAMMNLVRANWGLGAKMISDMMAPDMTKAEVRKQAALQKATCSPEVAAQLLGLSFDMDCREQVSEVRVPARVIHRRKDRTVRLDAGRTLAALFPDAELCVLDGEAHVPWEGDSAPVVSAVLEFLGTAEEEQASSEPAPAAQPASDAEDASWQRRGELWHVRFGGLEAVLPHRKGNEDLALLLANPMREISASELMAGGAAQAASEGGADDVLDARAREEYAERARAIEADLEEAEARGDLGHAELLRAEREQLLAELQAATGLAGRSRRLGDPAEKARKAVSARIKDAIGRVREVHPTLGEHLAESISTGLSCAYRPADPRLWRT